MLSNTLLVTLNNTSTDEEQQITVFAGNQNTPFAWTELWDRITLSIRTSQAGYSEAYQTMLASEDVLRRDWEQPEEDAAWADL